MIEPIGRYVPKIKFSRNLKEIKIMLRKEMKKSDLRSGMVVRLKDRSKRIVIETDKGLLFSGNGTYFFDRCLNDSMTHEKCPAIDIMEVYKVSEGSEIAKILDPDNDSKLTLIWKRPEVVEVTMQEVADKLGIPVENLRIKE